MFRLFVYSWMLWCLVKSTTHTHLLCFFYAFVTFNCYIICLWCHFGNGILTSNHFIFLNSYCPALNFFTVTITVISYSELRARESNHTQNIITHHCSMLSYVFFLQFNVLDPEYVGDNDFLLLLLTFICISTHNKHTLKSVFFSVFFF